MVLYGGTKEARTLLEGLLSAKKLFLPYAKDNYISFFHGENIDSWSEFISNYGPNAENHLAVIYLDQFDTETSEALVKIYPPLHQLLKVHHHKPDFLVINLLSQQMLALGLGRKNRFFAYDVSSNTEVWCWNFGIENGDKEYIQNFTSLDSKEVVYELISDLYSFGLSAYEDYLENGSTESSSQGVSIFEKMFPFLEVFDLDTGDY